MKPRFPTGLSSLPRFAGAVAVALATVASMPAAGQAQDYPQHPVRMVLPYPAGGPTDLLARVVAVKMGESLGQSVVVDNKPGASGMIGAENVARGAGRVHHPGQCIAARDQPEHPAQDAL